VLLELLEVMVLLFDLRLLMARDAAHSVVLKVVLLTVQGVRLVQEGGHVVEVVVLLVLVLVLVLMLLLVTRVIMTVVVQGIAVPDDKLVVRERFLVL